MIFAAAKPCYLPDISFFIRMSKADYFALADDIRFSKHDRVNRTRIKSPAGALWLTVPVLTTGKGAQSIREVRIDPTQHWGRKHWKTLCVNYRYAPYFEWYADFFERIYHQSWTYLIDLNLAIIEFLREALHIRTSLARTSEVVYRPGATESIVDLTKQFRCNVYLAEETDRAFLRESLFIRQGIRLSFLNLALPRYSHQIHGITDHLSIIDMLFHVGPETGIIIRSDGESV